MRNLKQCPFCGGNAEIKTTYDTDGTMCKYVCCRGCGGRTRGKWCRHGNDSLFFYSEVRNEWNIRAK